MEQTKQPQKLTDWSKVRSAILKKYPNLSKTQLTSLDSVIKKRQVEQAVRAGVIAPKDIALEYPDVAARLANEGVTGPISKEDKSKEGVISLIDQLKTLYNQKLPGGDYPDPTRQEDLSKGETGQLSTLASLNMAYAIAMNKAPDAKSYKRLRDGFTASLKDLTGDTGILTDQDQARIANSLPNFGDDDAAATKAWQSIDGILDSRFGKSGKYSYLQTKEAIKQDPVYQQMSNNSKSPITEGQMSSKMPGTQPVQGKTPIDIQQYQDSPFMQGLASVQTTLANSPTLPIVFGLLGKGILGGSPLGTAAGTTYGANLQNVAKRSLTNEPIIGSSNPIDTWAKTFLPQNVGEVTNPLAQGAVAGGIDQFFSGGGLKGNLSRIRDLIAGRSGGSVVGDTVAEAAKNAAANSASSLRAPATRVANQAAEDFGGKILSVPEAIAKRTASGTASRSLTSGTLKAGGANIVEDSIRSSLRSGIREASPWTGNLDDLISAVFKTRQGIGKVINPGNIGNAATTVGALALLRKIGLLPSGGQ